MNTKVLSHVATFAGAIAVGLLMLALPAQANPTEPSAPVCAFCSHSMGQTLSIGPMSGPFSKMIDSRFRFDADGHDGPNFFTGGDTVSKITFHGDQDDKDDTPGDAPEPGTLLLLATGLTGLAFLVRRAA